MGFNIESEFQHSPQEIAYIDGALNEVQDKLSEAMSQLEALFLEGFGQQLDIEEKTPGDYVTATDKKIEQTFRNWVQKNYPSHSVYGEEQGGLEVEQVPEWLWGIDPIDGTGNYQAGNPDASIVLSLRYKGEPVLAMCDLPIRSDGGSLQYVARVGKGITKNGVSVHSSHVEELKYATAVATKLTNPERMVSMVGELWDQVAGLHMNMSSVYEACRVASGEIGVGIFYDNGPHEWPAMYLFAKESGCKIGTLDNPDSKVSLQGMGNRSILIAGNRNLFNQAKGLVHMPARLF